MSRRGEKLLLFLASVRKQTCRRGSGCKVRPAFQKAGRYAKKNYARKLLGRARELAGVRADVCERTGESVGGNTVGGIFERSVGPYPSNP